MRKGYVLEDLLGEGTHSCVYRARARVDDRQVVAKALKTGSGQWRGALAEVVALDRCRDHPHVPALLARPDPFSSRACGL